MNLWQEYLLPKTLEEAMQALASAPRPLAPIAGGTDLLLDLELGRHSPVQTLVDITEVKELLALEVRGDRLFVGAGVPVNRLVLDPLTVRHAQALVEAGNLISGTPLLFATIGEIFSERAGVMNLGIEGMMLIGAMSGLAGASMSLVTDPGWVDGKTSGLGWIAVALVIFAGWDPMRGRWVSYFFALLRRLPIDLQNPALPLISTANNPSIGRLMDILPYLATIFILILGSRQSIRKRLGAPAALGNPYIGDERGL